MHPDATTFNDGRPRYIIDANGCWLWQGYCDAKGYALITIGRRQYRAYRWYYEQEHGAIPPGVALTHLCAVRHCVNPAHLEAARGALEMSAARVHLFWSHVDRSDPDGCWPWLLSVRRANYGQVTVNGKKWASPRLAYTLTYGAFPDDLYVCHRCDNPRCCRPDHLFLGTAVDNAADMARKGRYRGIPAPRRYGADHHNVKLTAADVVQIRQRAARGERHTALARAFGVNRSTIGYITRRHTWAQVPDEPLGAVGRDQES